MNTHNLRPSHRPDTIPDIAIDQGYVTETIESLFAIDNPLFDADLRDEDERRSQSVTSRSIRSSS